MEPNVAALELVDEIGDARRRYLDAVLHDCETPVGQIDADEQRHHVVQADQVAYDVARFAVESDEELQLPVVEIVEAADAVMVVVVVGVCGRF